MREPQQARSRDTRSRLLDAAIDSLVEVGYARTSTVAVTARAGVSRGSLLHQFPSRDALLLAAMGHLVTEGLNELTRSITPSPHPLSAAEIVDVLWRTFRMRYFWASVELWIAARTDPALRADIHPQARLLGTVVDDAFGRLFDPALVASPGFAELRSLLITSMRGAALAYAFTPRDPATEPLLPTWTALVHDFVAR